MPRALVFETARNQPKTHRIMQPVCVGLKRAGYVVERRDSMQYPFGDESTADVLAIWGDYHGTERIYADRHQFPLLIHIDNGYFQRGHFYGYYTVTRNAKQPAAPSEHVPVCKGGRWQALGETLRPWQSGGTDVLVLGLSRKQCQTLGFPYPEWNKTLLTRVRDWSQRRCVYREKRYDGLDAPLREVLRGGSWFLVVGYNTKGLLEAVVEGVPIQAEGPCVAQYFSPSPGAYLTGKPYCRLFSPDRESFFRWLAWQQWTLTEITQGKPFVSPLWQRQEAA